MNDPIFSVDKIDYMNSQHRVLRNHLSQDVLNRNYSWNDNHFADIHCYRTVFSYRKTFIFFHKTNCTDLSFDPIKMWLQLLFSLPFVYFYFFFFHFFFASLFYSILFYSTIDWISIKKFTQSPRMTFDNDKLINSIDWKSILMTNIKSSAIHQKRAHSWQFHCDVMWRSYNDFQ